MLDGIILINKKEGVSSRMVDNRLGKLFNTRKIGHLGTLDPFASGLLVIGINKGCKFLPYLDDSKKTYIASLYLGKKYDTGDCTGNIIEEREVRDYSKEEVIEALNSFLGKGKQIPPIYSAIKKDGVPSYKKARKGEEVMMEPRDIEVFSINLIALMGCNIVFTVTVSRGTYIRTLGEDIATKLGTIGYLDKLRRTSIGNILLSEAKGEEEISEADIVDPTIYIKGMYHVEIKEEKVNDVLNGKPLRISKEYGNQVLITTHGHGIAVYKIQEDGLYHSLRGLF